MRSPVFLAVYADFSFCRLFLSTRVDFFVYLLIMAVYSKKEFAKECGLDFKSIYIYIKRGKIILTGNIIDDAIPENEYFLLSRKKILNNPSPVIIPEISVNKPSEFINKDSPKVRSLIEKAIKNNEKNDLKVQSPPPDNQRYNLDVEQKTLDIEKREQEIALLKIKIEKLSGEVIPTDIVNMTFAQHFKSFTVSFKNGADNLLMEIQKLKELSREEVALLRGKLIEIVNLAVNDGINESKKSIRNIVNEYSDKKGIGERE